ncbi:nuclear factor 7, ovary-like [Paramisgurnus dabryanus]|uniref:nuclear factor 7, ovary-like n=1 Tax=Paramisgurnus dabryanus TaxID=90735 RepID=UPI0031F3D416
MDSLSEEDLTCPVCYEIFKDPVFLSCGHNVCKECLQQFWKTKNTQQCPICRRRSSKDEPPGNLVLKNICESFSLKISQRTSSGSQESCSLHNEKLMLFCLEDKEPVCLVCRDSQKHANHTFRPISEIVSSYKRELSTVLQSLKEKLKYREEMKGEYDITCVHTKTQSLQTETLIKEEFKKLRQFLIDEEEATINALRKEEDQKSQMIKEKLEKMNMEISALSDIIKDTEERTKTNDILFVKNFKATIERAQVSPPLSEMASGTLINVADYLGNLAFKIWKKMQHLIQYTPVILDPNTAHPKLILSDDLSSLKKGIRIESPFPLYSERFNKYPCVLGSEGFISGSHWWDIEVHNHSDWIIGITTESNRRNTDFFINNVWCMWYRDDQYFLQSPEKPTIALTVQKKLQRVRVQLDWTRGKVSFCDPITNKCLCTLTTTFTEKVFPFFYNSHAASPLKILPIKVFVTTEQC